jgi:hypothetical protein
MIILSKRATKKLAKFAAKLREDWTVGGVRVGDLRAGVVSKGSTGAAFMAGMDAALEKAAKDPAVPPSPATPKTGPVLQLGGQPSRRRRRRKGTELVVADDPNSAADEALK